MSQTLRDQVIAAQAARNEALRRMHRAIELYQGAVERIAELETQLAALNLQLGDTADRPAHRRGHWYAESQPIMEETGLMDKRN